ncbi:MAG: PQQ-binding-like beta-propeller repeat protein, partial [Phycisphaeraceae bacterium]|nr:PQQ-binding-like beta-propeller repeat protein [Phycisphaeraceae bacterium]
MHTALNPHRGVSAILATVSALAISMAAAAQHRLITQGNDRLAIVDAEGDIEWEMPWRGIHDIHVLPDGHIMVQRGASEVVEIDPDTKQVVWSYDSRVRNGNSGKAVEVHAFQPLPPKSAVNPTGEWRLMIAESGPARIIEVDRTGTML